MAWGKPKDWKEQCGKPVWRLINGVKFSNPCRKKKNHRGKCR